MLNITKNWTEFKNLIDQNILFVENVVGSDYELYAQDGNLFYKCLLTSSDITDYQTNYQSKKSLLLHPVDADGKPYSRAESRPLDKTTYFTMAGDSSTTRGDGTELRWDFSNSDDIITAPSGFKRKRVKISFIDEVNLKEGTIYFIDKLWGSYIDLLVVAPAPIAHPSVDVTLDHFVNKYFMTNTNILGDELNTEAASSNIPAGIEFWLEITVPDTDNSSKGYVSLEIYRPNTV